MSTAGTGIPSLVHFTPRSMPQARPEATDEHPPPHPAAPAVEALLRTSDDFVSAQAIHARLRGPATRSGWPRSTEPCGR